MLLTHNTKNTKQIYNRRNTRAVRDREAAQLFHAPPLSGGTFFFSALNIPATVRSLRSAGLTRVQGDRGLLPLIAQRRALVYLNARVSALLLLK